MGLPLLRRDALCEREISVSFQKLQNIFCTMWIVPYIDGFKQQISVNRTIKGGHIQCITPHKRKNPAYWLNQKAGFLGCNKHLKSIFFRFVDETKSKLNAVGSTWRGGVRARNGWWLFIKNCRSKADFAPAWLTTMNLLFLKLVAAQRVSWVSPVLVPNSAPSCRYKARLSNLFWIRTVSW